jgi:hypothetical protein
MFVKKRLGSRLAAHSRCAEKPPGGLTATSGSKKPPDSAKGSQLQLFCRRLKSLQAAAKSLQAAYPPSRPIFFINKLALKL